MAKPSLTELATGAGISRSYASELLNGKREPSLALAVRIFRKTGWQHERIAKLDAAQIDALEVVSPYPNESAAA